MYKALIADDEAPIREGISGYLSEMGLFSEVYTCKNGAEALEAALKHAPDLILTDIRMPVMDGLEFLSRYARSPHNSRMIVLSGYSEFEYAREAMRSGVSDYLLKPIDNQLLAEKVLQQIAELKSAEDDAHLAEARLLSSALAGDPEALQILSERGGDTPYMVAVCAIAPLMGAEGDYVELVAKRFAGAVQAIGHPAQHTLKYGVPVAVVPFPDKLPDPLQIARKLRRAIEVDPDRYIVRVGVSRMYTCASLINRPYREALYAALRCLRTSVPAAGYRPSPVTYDHAAFLNSAEALKTVTVKAVNKGDPESVRRASGDLYQFLSAGKYGDEANVLFLQQTLQAALDRPDTNARLSFKQPEQLLSRMICCKRFDEIEPLFRDALLHASAPAGDDVRGACPGAMMGEILQYIDQNLESDLTLSGVSTRFFLSESHLFRLFKNKTPYTFNEYLTRARVRKACELLATTNLKIYAVGDRVGFKNTKYFATLFKEQTGMTPSEFRNW